MRVGAGSLQQSPQARTLLLARVCCCRPHRHDHRCEHVGLPLMTAIQKICCSLASTCRHSLRRLQQLLSAQQSVTRLHLLWINLHLCGKNTHLGLDVSFARQSLALNTSTCLGDTAGNAEESTATCAHTTRHPYRFSRGIQAVCHVFRAQQKWLMSTSAPSVMTAYRCRWMACGGAATAGKRSVSACTTLTRRSVKSATASSRGCRCDHQH
mmetsp:Transcript_41540/g.91293  ORF Transcript_41540/g.91293 Transcript_41540/m.91293 type:complete len:211 (-) Transcript_41540:50-682(-)